MPLPRTYVATPKDIEKKWFVVDAEDLVLGRMASLIALRVRGKHKPSYTPNMDCGDHVIVVNAEKVRLTGQQAREQNLLLAHRLSGRHQGTHSRENSRRQIPDPRCRKSR
jgi:ribosomal protein L13